jgi:hypothetical protein
MEDVDLLMREVHSYLRAVEAFRAEGHEPCWLPEPLGLPAPPAPARRLSGTSEFLARLDRG